MMNRTSPSEETTDFLFFLSFFSNVNVWMSNISVCLELLMVFPRKSFKSNHSCNDRLFSFLLDRFGHALKQIQKSTYSWIKEWARVLHGNIDCVVSDALRWRRRLENKIYRRMDGHFDFCCRLEMKRKRLAILMNIQCAFVFVLASRKISFGKPLHERPAAWILDVSD